MGGPASADRGGVGVCRPRAQAVHSWGDKIGHGNAVCDGCGSEWDYNKTAPVGSFAPNGLPILPGETRVIPLVPQADRPDAPAPTLRFPVRLKGRLETSAGAVDVEGTFPG